MCIVKTEIIGSVSLSRVFLCPLSNCKGRVNLLICVIIFDISYQGFSGSALSALVKGLPDALQRQYEYEDPIVRGGKHLLHSPFFKVSWNEGVIKLMQVHFIHLTSQV